MMPGRGGRVGRDWKGVGWAQGSRIDAETIIQQRERIKRKTIEYRRLQHRKIAA